MLVFLRHLERLIFKGGSISEGDLLFVQMKGKLKEKKLMGIFGGVSKSSVLTKNFDFELRLNLHSV